jgi:hypothetical protein
MTKQNLEILEFEDKKTTAGKRYTRFKTDEGWMSCFDKKSCEALKDKEGETVSVDVAEANGFKNIRKYLGNAKESDDDEEESEEEEKPAKKEAVVQKTFSKETPKSMLVSYAKDLLVAGWEFEKAVKAVKDLEKAFEPEIAKPKRNLKKEIVQYLQKNPDGVEISKLMVDLKINEAETQIEITKLLDEGIVFEPKPGKVRFL